MLLSVKHRPIILCAETIFVCLLFSRRFRRNSRLLQWLVLFRQFNTIGPLFVHHALLPYVLSTSFSTHPKPHHEIKSHSKAEGSPFHFFDSMSLSPLFRHCETVQISHFFPIFFLLLQMVPHQFLIFCNIIDVQKIPKGPPFTFFGTMRLTGNFKKDFEKNSEIFSSIFSFLRAFVVSSCRKSGFRVNH